MKTFAEKCIKKIKWCVSKITYKMVMLVVGIILLIIAYTSFKVSINHQINNNTKVYLSSVLDESLDRVGIKVNEEINILKTIAAIFNNEEDLNGEAAKQHLMEQLKLHGFLGIRLTDQTGHTITSIGNVSAGAATDYMEPCMEKGDCISSVLRNENEEYIDLSVPLYYQNENIGILVCSYDMNEFTEIIDSSYFEKIGTTFISQEDGTLISRPESVGNNTNLFKMLDSINTYNEKSIRKLKNSIQNGESGIISFGSGKYKRYICYKVIPETSWYSVSIISGSAIEPLAKKISKLSMVLAMETAAICALYISIIIIVEYKRYKTKRRLFQQTDI